MRFGFLHVNWTSRFAHTLIAHERRTHYSVIDVWLFSYKNYMLQPYDKRTDYNISERKP